MKKIKYRSMWFHNRWDRFAARLCDGFSKESIQAAAEQIRKIIDADILDEISKKKK